MNPVLNISLTFPCINRKTLDHYSTVGARGNYLERVATLQVERAMLITLVDSRDAASSSPFVPTLYELINYGTMCRWFIWEQEMFQPFFFLSPVHSSWGEALYHDSMHNEAFNPALKWVNQNNKETLSIKLLGRVGEWQQTIAWVCFVFVLLFHLSHLQFNGQLPLHSVFNTHT